VSAPPGLLIVELSNTSNTVPHRAGKYVFFLSTELANSTGAAKVKDYDVIWRDDVWFTHPIEVDVEKPGDVGCDLNWLGSKSPIKLPGGGIQLVTYTLAPASAVGGTVTSGGGRDSQRTGRPRPPSVFET
jgi:hypothetical protein